MDNNEKLNITKIFHQNYNLEEDGIPPHWAVQYYVNGWAEYEYFDTYEEALKWAKDHGYGDE